MSPTNAVGDSAETEPPAAASEEISESASPSLQQRKRSVSIKAPEIEVHLYRRGNNPPVVFKSRLGGWDQDLLEVQEILDRYGLKSLHAFNPESAIRGVPIRFNVRNGRSLISYSDGAVIHLYGEPKDSLVKPVTKILVGVALLSLLLAVLLKEHPEWLNLSKFTGGSFPPWVLACIVIVFMRLRKRTKDVLKKYGY